MCIRPRPDLIDVVVKEWGTAAIGVQRLQKAFGRDLVREHDVHHVSGACISPMHRQAYKGGSLRFHEQDAVAHTLFDKVFVLAHHCARGLGKMKPSQRREGGRGKNQGHGRYLTVVIMRSQRILDSPCCSSFCLLNQMNDARPTMWSSGTNPHMRLSADLCRLSPIIQ